MVKQHNGFTRCRSTISRSSYSEGYVYIYAKCDGIIDGNIDRNIDGNVTLVNLLTAVLFAIIASIYDYLRIF